MVIRIAVAIAALLTGPVSFVRAQTDGPIWQPIGYYEHAPIRESSGLVTSRQYAGVYWTLNDSGNPNVLYATRQNGQLIREIPVPDASNYDWEALAVDDDGQLWIGEIGNNSRRRTDLRVYRVPEPNPFEDTVAVVTGVFPYRYPERNVDAEGMFIANGLPHIVSKEREQAVLFQFTELNPDTSKVHVLEPVGTCKDAHWITGASLSRDGRRLAICTYDALWVYHTETDTTLAALVGTNPWALTHDFGVEAIAFDQDDLLLTSERRDIYRLPQWWYESQFPLPPRRIQPISDHRTQPVSVAAREEYYRDAGIDMGGAHLALLSKQSGGYKVGLDSYDLEPASPFVPTFLVVGPFDKQEDDNINAPLPPEQNLALTGAFTGAGNRTLQWHLATARDDGRLDLLAALGPDVPRYAVAYALTYAYSKKDRAADLLIGSDDQVAVWINGEEVHRNNANRGAQPDSDIVSCRLKAGWNEVLCKIGQSSGGWALYLRFSDPGGTLKYSINPK